MAHSKTSLALCFNACSLRDIILSKCRDKETQVVGRSVLLWTNLSAPMTKDSAFSQVLTFSSCLQVKIPHWQLIQKLIALGTNWNHNKMVFRQKRVTWSISSQDTSVRHKVGAGRNIQPSSEFQMSAHASNQASSCSQWKVAIEMKRILKRGMSVFLKLWESGNQRQKHFTPGYLQFSACNIYNLFKIRTFWLEWWQHKIFFKTLSAREILTKLVQCWSDLICLVLCQSHRINYSYCLKWGCNKNITDTVPA